MIQSRYDKITSNIGIITFILISIITSYFISSNSFKRNEEFLNKQYLIKVSYLLNNKISNNLTNFKKEISFYENKFKKLRSTYPFNWNTYSYYTCNFYACGINLNSNNIFQNHIKECQESFLSRIEYFEGKFLIINFTNIEKFIIKNISQKINEIDFNLNNKYLIIITDEFIANGFVKKPININFFLNKLYTKNNKITLPLTIDGFSKYIL